MSEKSVANAEQQRLLEYEQRQSNWKHWGPYLSERAWGTVREDYSEYGAAWDYFTHDQARSRAYRWNEDGIAGICDRYQYLCFALCLWNGNDPILKERLFGLAGPEGNHGEDVKELYHYLDSAPTHSYMKMLYRYPQAAFPYADLVAENGRRGYDDDEYELIDSGIFDDDRYFDVVIEYAKQAQNDILCRITVTNRGAESATIDLLPTLWFRNTWSWGYDSGPMGDVEEKPAVSQIGEQTLRARHAALGDMFCYTPDADELLFTENESNSERLFGVANRSPYVKDAFHRYLIDGDAQAINPQRSGTKVAARHHLKLEGGAAHTIRLRLCDSPQQQPLANFDATFSRRIAETDAFYDDVQQHIDDPELRLIQRQAFAGMLWSKQLYYYDMLQWLNGDPGTAPPETRLQGRNSNWEHLVNFDIISMPDKWEYPWYATWDLAFHCIALVLVDRAFAKRQLLLTTREWYMHPNGQLPAYEWAFDDVNPPVHAWAAWRVYKLDAVQTGTPDRAFLEAVFHKLMLNFTWWVNRKDEDGRNVFQGGFLGLDNISVFDRSQQLPTGGHLDQSDGTAWMAGYCLQLMTIALELAIENDVYQDMATKLFEHFLRIANAMSAVGENLQSLWDEADGFFYDMLHLPDDRVVPLKVRSLVGLLPLFAAASVPPRLFDNMSTFRRRMRWFLDNRPRYRGYLCSVEHGDGSSHHLIALLNEDRLRLVLRRMLDEDEFLSPYGIRSLSRIHDAEPYEFHYEGETHAVPYWPAESRSGLFGGNSNWRGPIWFPINYLIIDALHRTYNYYGDDFKVECPTGSGVYLTLDQVAAELTRRLISIFTVDGDGRRPFNGANSRQQPQWRDELLFYEYFHGDNGKGLGASHQTGWTGLIVNLIDDLAANNDKGYNE